MTSEWVHDAALGVAVREAGDVLQVRSLSEKGQFRIKTAIEAAYGTLG